MACTFDNLEKVFFLLKHTSWHTTRDKSQYQCLHFSWLLWQCVCLSRGHTTGLFPISCPQLGQYNVARTWQGGRVSLVSSLFCRAKGEGLSFDWGAMGNLWQGLLLGTQLYLAGFVQNVARGRRRVFAPADVDWTATNAVRVDLLRANVWVLPTLRGLLYLDSYGHSKIYSSRCSAEATLWMWVHFHTLKINAGAEVPAECRSACFHCSILHWHFQATSGIRTAGKCHSQAGSANLHLKILEPRAGSTMPDVDLCSPVRKYWCDFVLLFQRQDGRAKNYSQWNQIPFWWPLWHGSHTLCTGTIQEVDEENFMQYFLRLRPNLSQCIPYPNLCLFSLWTWWRQECKWQSQVELQSQAHLVWSLGWSRMRASPPYIMVCPLVFWGKPHTPQQDWASTPGCLRNSPLMANLPTLPWKQP